MIEKSFVLQGESVSFVPSQVSSEGSDILSTVYASAAPDKSKNITEANIILVIFPI